MSTKEKLQNSYGSLEIKSVAIEIPESILNIKDRIERTAFNTGNVILAKWSGSHLLLLSFLKLLYRKGVKMLDAEISELLLPHQMLFYLSPPVVL